MADVSGADLAVALLVGLGLGALFFGGLRLTVARIATARRPAVVFYGSFLVRTAAVVAGFIWVGHGEWQRYVAALAGFVAMRILVVWVWGREPPKNGA